MLYGDDVHVGAQWRYILSAQRGRVISSVVLVRLTCCVAVFFKGARGILGKKARDVCEAVVL